MVQKNAIRDKNHIKSLERGLKLLEILGQSAQSQTLSEIANRCDINKTATQRFLNTFRTLGYIKRDENKRYFLTAKILSVGFNYLNSSNLRMVSKPYIDDLSSELNKTINLSILDGIEVLYLYRKEKAKYLKYDLYVGSKLPSYCTSSGKVLLAGLNDMELKERIDSMSLEPITNKTIISKTILLKDIMKTRKRGYSVCDQELSMDLYSMAVPLIDQNDKSIAAINVTLDARHKHNPNKKQIIEKLIQKGKVISELLGYNGPYPKI